MNKSKLLFWNDSKDFVKELLPKLNKLEVLVPNSETEILKLHEKWQADYMLLPYDMEKINSGELIQKIRYVDNKVKIIIYMADRNSSAIVDYLLYGSNEIIIEPLDVEKLFEKIEKIDRVNLRPI